MDISGSSCAACLTAVFAACTAVGGIADKIAVWGYVLDKTPTACPFVFGKTDYSLERAAAEFGFSKAMYMNSCFNQEYLDKNFKYWDRECFENCVDNRLKDVQLEKLRGLDEVWCATTHGKKLESSIAIARLSLKYPNIVGVNFDDFNGANSELGMSVEKMRELKAAMRAINPKMKISVVSYVKDSNGTDFDLTPYRGEIDHVSRWKWVTETNYWHNLRADVAELRRQVGPEAKIVHGLYIHNFAKDMKCPEALPLDYFKLSAAAALDAVADGTLDGIILPQVAWYSMPTHREHFDWFLRRVRDMDRAAVLPAGATVGMTQADVNYVIAAATKPGGIHFAGAEPDPLFTGDGHCVPHFSPKCMHNQQAEKGKSPWQQGRH